MTFVFSQIHICFLYRPQKSIHESFQTDILRNNTQGTTNISEKLLRDRIEPVNLPLLFREVTEILSAEERVMIGKMRPAKYDGYSLLHMAVDCTATDVDIVQTLLEKYEADAGAVTLTDEYSVTDLCAENERKDLEDLIESYTIENSQRMSKRMKT